MAQALVVMMAGFKAALAPGTALVTSVLWLAPLMMWLAGAAMAIAG